MILNNGRVETDGGQKVRFTLQVDMLGCLAVRGILGASFRFRTQRTAALFAYLAYHSARSHSRDLLAELFWPESDPDSARLNVRVALSSLRSELLAATNTPSILIADRNSVRLDSDLLSTDVQVFEARLRAAKQCGDELMWLENLESAVAAYNGPLLPELHDEWVFSERERLARARLEAAGFLRKAKAQAKDLDGAIKYAELCAIEEPYDEDAHVALIELLMERGRPMDAAERFERIRERLKSDLGLEPSARLSAVANRLPARPSEFGPPRRTRSRRSRASEAPNATSRAGAAHVRARLPLHLTRFFGRDQELDLLESLVVSADQTSRLITITGTAGAGKTRLLIEAANRVGAAFPGGMWFVDLSPLRDARGILSSIANSIGLVGSSGSDLAAKVADMLSRGPALLMLDNMEHLIPANSEEPDQGLHGIVNLLGLVPNLKVLITSRRTIGVPGEKEVRIGPLPIPEADTPPSAAGSIPSVGLLVDRIRLIQPGFELSDHNVESVAAVCRRLEGIPLAIELAASWSNGLSLEQISKKLAINEPVLVSRHRGIVDRHRSLRDAIKWSFDLLPHAAREFLQGLSVFRGGWSLDAASSILDEPRALERLADLHDRSLVLVSEVGGSKRFRLLESVREYAYESTDADRRSRLEAKHADYFAAIAKESSHRIRGFDHQEWMLRVNQDEDNIRAALAHYLSAGRSQGARFASDLARYWEVAGRDEEAFTAFQYLLAGEISDLESSITARIAFARFCLKSPARAEQAMNLAQEALALNTGLDRPDLEARALYVIAHLVYYRAEYESALELFGRVCETFERLGNPSGMGDCLINLGDIELRRANAESAARHWRRGMEVSVAAGDARNVAIFQENLGELAWAQGRYDEATRLVESALQTTRSIGDRLTEAYVLWTLGRLAMVGFRFGEARRLLFESVRIHADLRMSHRARPVQCSLAHLDLRTGHAKQAETRLHALVDEASPGEVDRTKALYGLAIIELDRGHLPTARSFLQEALCYAPQFNEVRDTLLMLEAAACCAACRGQSAEAAELLVSIDRFRMLRGPVRDQVDAQAYDRAISLVAQSNGVKLSPDALADESMGQDVQELASQALRALACG